MKGDECTKEMWILKKLRVICKLIYRDFFAHGNIASFCKECGCEIRDFVAPDEIWKLIDPHIKHGHTLCYNCFCDYCAEFGLPSIWKLGA